MHNESQSLKSRFRATVSASLFGALLACSLRQAHVSGIARASLRSWRHEHSPFLVFALTEMSLLRYFLALVLVLSLPPLFLYWCLIHPFVRFWRARGVAATYSIILTLIVGAMVALFSVRHHLLTIDWGTNYWLIGLGILFLLFSGFMRFALQKQLTVATLLGLPEIAPDHYPRKLVTEGLYARIRHPRYLQILIALSGYALISNYFAVYLLVALWMPGIYLIVLLEERELRAHFGAAYDEYCRRVPRFWPVLRPRSHAGR
jgi:protein-S-isoprenylcysteine O-methyltransferase Ste14